MRYFQPKRTPRRAPKWKRNEPSRAAEWNLSELWQSLRRQLERAARGGSTRWGGGVRKQSVECMRFVYKQKINKPPGWRRCHWPRVE